MSFQQGLSGLNAAAKNLEVIGNNVANANTIGFKSSRAQFADMYANALAGSSNAAGIGVMVSSVAQQFTQGNITTTSNPLDIAINGDGFYRLSTNGVISYTRNGQFSLDNASYLVSPSGARLQGYPVDVNGNIVTAAPTDLRLSTADIDPNATTKAEMVATLDSRKTAITTAFNLNDSTTYHNASGMTVYDSLGQSHSIQLYFRKTAANAWEVYGSENGAQIGATPLGTLNFTTSGAIDTTTTTLPFAVSLPTTNGSVTPLNFTLDFTGTTQFAANYGVTRLDQDGYAVGRLASFSVDQDGKISGVYTNGQTRVQGQIVLASFANNQGLIPTGNNEWIESSASGQPLVGAPNSGNLGTLQSSALEEANIDLTAELVNMIVAQRTYQANAQTIKTQDSILQTLVNLR